MGSGFFSCWTVSHSLCMYVHGRCLLWFCFRLRQIEAQTKLTGLLWTIGTHWMFACCLLLNLILSLSMRGALHFIHIWRNYEFARARLQCCYYLSNEMLCKNWQKGNNKCGEWILRQAVIAYTFPHVLLHLLVSFWVIPVISEQIISKVPELSFEKTSWSESNVEVICWQSICSETLSKLYEYIFSFLLGPGASVF